MSKSTEDDNKQHIEKAKELVSNSVCLPSSISLTSEQLEKIIKVING